MKRKVLLILLTVTMCFALSGCDGVDRDMRAVEMCAEQYLQAFKTVGMKEAVQYCHFEANEFHSQDVHRALYIRAGCAIQDYRIQNIEKINDELYVLTLELQDAGGQWTTVYNFVGYIDGVYRYINGISHIPESLRTGFVPEAYQTVDVM